MAKIFALLDGKKTYLTSGAGIIVVGLWMFQVVDTETASKLLAFLGFGAAIALRAGIAKPE